MTVKCQAYKNKPLEFPVSPVLRTLHCASTARYRGSSPAWGPKIPHATQYDQKKKISKSIWRATHEKMVNIIHVQGNVPQYIPARQGKLKRSAMPSADKNAE